MPHNPKLNLKRILGKGCLEPATVVSTTETSRYAGSESSAKPQRLPKQNVKKRPPFKSKQRWGPVGNPGEQLNHQNLWTFREGSHRLQWLCPVSWYTWSKETEETREWKHCALLPHQSRNYQLQLCVRYFCTPISQKATMLKVFLEARQKVPGKSQRNIRLHGTSS